MKILHLLQSNRFSGAENVVCQIINMFNEEADIQKPSTTKKPSTKHVIIANKKRDNQ